MKVFAAQLQLRGHVSLTPVMSRCEMYFLYIQELVPKQTFKTQANGFGLYCNDT